MAAMTDVMTAATRSSSPPAAAAKDDVDAEKLRFIEEVTSDVDAVQERVLAEILGLNAETEYLRKCGLSGATDRATFRAKVPMVAYEDLKPYIRRIADGDRSPILSGQPVSVFFCSSGTSAGERKLIPKVDGDLDRRKSLYSLITPVMNMHVAGLDKGKGLYFLFVRQETKTLGGLLVQSGLTNYYKSDHFKNRPLDAYNTYTSPTAAILCEDTFQSMYAHMICGLCQRHDVLRVGAVFASTLVRAIRFLQLNWEKLATDIEAGVLTPLVTDPSVREAVAGILRPDPELAQFIHDECSKGDDWAGIITRIWPNTKYLDAIVTGAMAHYIPALKYYGGDLPMVSTMYVSSEAMYGVNLQPMCDPSKVSYTIIPSLAYLEFLPVDDDKTTSRGTASYTASQLVDLAHVEAGREYELVITTHAGLNRYRVGDVLRVAGFHNTAPQFQFVRRANVLLSVDIEKTDEAELQSAVDRASALLHRHDAGLVDYTSRACTESFPGHYVIYWELLAKRPGASAMVDKETLDKCCLEMEEAFNMLYRECRVEDGSIGPLEIRVVRTGTFEDLLEYAISRGASISQYKVPRCVTLAPIVELLDSHVVSSHFSPAVPHWTPDPSLSSTAGKCSGS